MLLYNKKKKEDIYLVIAAHDTNTSNKVLEAHYKTGKDNLRMVADQALLESLLGGKQGALTLFGILNDKDKKVKLVIDSKLTHSAERIGFHPMQNDATTSIT